MKLAAYRLVQEGLIVARVECSDDEKARREIDHYAMVYAQDGACMVQHRVGKRWNALYILAPASTPEQPTGGEG